jgi:hypothetical protein
MKIGYFKHWFRPPFSFVEWLRGQGVEVEEIDYSQPGYLEKYDVALIEQNGFDDYVENDELYIQDWVYRGGICLFMHQDYRRWAPYFLPHAQVGYTQLISRYMETIRVAADTPVYYNYMMPWIEPRGKGLFSTPNRIAPDEMLDWRIQVNSFDILSHPEGPVTPEEVRTAALSCFLANPAWEILGSYMDPAVRDGALLLQARHGKGLFFLNQLLFPEVQTPEAEKCLAFWRRYLPNLLAYLKRFRAGQPEPSAQGRGALPEKRNYKLAIHMHSLDWFGADSAPGTINAEMRLMDYDICSLALKDAAPYGGKLNPAKYSDDKVLFLDGQEYHPFNWNQMKTVGGKAYPAECRRFHNTYHILAIGIDHDAYTPEFTRSFFSDEEVDAYLKRAIAFVHEHHGAACATHPYVDYWHSYPEYDAVDQEPMGPLSGSDIEKYWLQGGRIAVMNSVDLFGLRRILDNPAVNFVYLQGERPCQASVVKAIRAHHTLAAAHFAEGDVTLDDNTLPGDAVDPSQPHTLKIHARLADGELRELRVYSADKALERRALSGLSVDAEIDIPAGAIDRFLRVEIEGDTPLHILVSTPFFAEGRA